MNIQAIDNNATSDIINDEVKEISKDIVKPLFNAKAIPGNPAIWVGIFSELTEFALFFVIYFIARVHYPDEFSDGPTHLHTLAGTLNTLVLISSSYFLVKGIFALRNDSPDLAVRWLSLTLFCGACYFAIKLWEYQWNADSGISINTNNFFAVYYYTTFNHLLHVGWGSLGIIWSITQIKSGNFTADNHSGLIAAACYWHMIDLAWIVIFPLLYVIR
jgi:cytochrome c oxidase subunit 3